MRSFPTILLLAVIFPTSLWGQANLVPAESDSVKGKVKLEEGFTANWLLSGNFSFGSSSQVIGQADGDTVTIGLDSDLAFFHRRDRRQWRNKLLLSEATTRTATIDRYVKSSDDFKYETTYLYGLKSYPNVGPYFKTSVETSLFFGEDVRSEPTTYTFKDSTRSDVTSEKLRLTDGFRPLTTKESIGFFATVKDTETMSLEFRSGFGALQVKAKNQLALDDDASTDAIEVKTLESFDQAGFELGMDWSGQLDEKSHYEVSLTTLTPLIHNFNEENDTKQTDIQLTNMDAKARLTTEMYSWANLSYEFNLKRQPQLLDEYQIQHRLVVNLTHQLL